jgi:hypothetical protein
MNVGAALIPATGPLSGNRPRICSYACHQRPRTLA